MTEVPIIRRTSIMKELNISIQKNLGWVKSMLHLLDFSIDCSYDLSQLFSRNLRVSFCVARFTFIQNNYLKFVGIHNHFDIIKLVNPVSYSDSITKTRSSSLFLKLHLVIFQIGIDLKQITIERFAINRLCSMQSNIFNCSYKEVIYFPINSSIMCISTH